MKKGCIGLELIESLEECKRKIEWVVEIDLAVFRHNGGERTKRDFKRDIAHDISNNIKSSLDGHIFCNSTAIDDCH